MKPIDEQLAEKDEQLAEKDEQLAEKGDEELAQYYTELQDSAKKTMTRLSLLGIGILLATFIAAFVLLETLNSNASTATVLEKLTLSIPGAVIFAYLSVEAAVYRRLSIQSGLVAAQLKTVDLFLNHLGKTREEDKVRDEIIKELGLKLFVGVPVEEQHRERFKRKEYRPAPSSPPGTSSKAENLSAVTESLSAVTESLKVASDLIQRTSGQRP
jgi:hypothetical protein